MENEHTLRSIENTRCGGYTHDSENEHTMWGRDTHTCTARYVNDIAYATETEDFLIYNLLG